MLNYNLQAFLAIVDHSTVSMAAKQIGLTQTGVTQRLKALERDLGVSLFTRSRKGMRLTEEGCRLYQHCLEVKDTEGRLRAAIKGAGKDQFVNCWISGPASVLSGRVAGQVREFYSKWPMLNLSFVYDVNRKRIELLKTGKTDLAVLTTKTDNELEYKEMAPWEFVMVIPYRWRKRKFREVVEKERYFLYNPEDEICIRYMKQFKMADRMRKPPLYVNDNHAILQLIAGEVGYGVLPVEVLSEKLHLKEIAIGNDGRSLNIPLWLSWYPRQEPPKYFSELIGAIN